MNRTTLYILILFVLSLLAYFAINSRQSTTVNTEETAFAFEDTTAISKIHITDRNKRTATLYRQNSSTWTVNDRYYARPDAINTLLKTIKGVRIKSPVAKTAYDNVMKSFQNPIKTVEIYTDNVNSPAKKYYIGGTTNNKRGTHMLLDGFDMPYVTDILGVDGNLVIRYFSGEEEWRDRKVFSYQPNEIKSIEVAYPTVPQQSFRLDTQEGTFAVTPLDASAQMSDKAQLNQEVCEEYVQQFKQVFLEAFENDYLAKDSVKASIPFCVITVTNTQNQQRAMVIHYMPVNQRSKAQIDEKGRAIPFDSDRYFAFLNNGKDFVIIQQYVFGEILKNYKDFFAVPRI